MFKKLWKSISDWWENNKNVVHNFVIPKLESYTDDLANLLNITKEEAKRIIAVISDYLKRQL